MRNPIRIFSGIPSANVMKTAVCVAVSFVLFLAFCSIPHSAAAQEDIASPAPAGQPAQVLEAPKMAEAPPAARAPLVVIVPVEGFIDGGLFDSLKRRMKEAQDMSPDLIVLRIDTYGGALIFAMEITEYLAAIDTPKTVAYVPTKAYSAGAMIAMAAREIVMAPNASIGDAAPVVETPEGPQIQNDKTQSPVRNVFRKYAERNGYPIPLAEAMVTPEIEVYEVTFNDGTKQFIEAVDFENLPKEKKDAVKEKRVIDRKGQLLTMSAKEAKEYGFAKFIAKDMNELLADYNMPNARLVTTDVNWSEWLVRKLNHPAVASLLLLVGIIGVYMEFKVPGFGLPGIVAILCLATFFFSKHLSGMAEYWEMIVFFIGMVLLGIEIFLLPGFGLTGFAGVALMFGGLILAMLPKKISATPLDLNFIVVTGAYMLASLVASFFAAAAITRFLPRTPVVGQIYLGAPAPEAVAHGEGAGITEGRHLIGKEGKTVSMLRPAGRASIDGELLDVTTQGELVSKDALVVVIAQKANNIIVKEVRKA